MKTRHTATVDFYFYLDEGQNAIDEANRIAKQLSTEGDRQEKVLEIHKTPFASLKAEKVYGV